MYYIIFMYLYNIYYTNTGIRDSRIHAHFDWNSHHKSYYIIYI